MDILFEISVGAFEGDTSDENDWCLVDDTTKVVEPFMETVFDGLVKLLEWYTVLVVLLDESELIAVE